MPSVNDIQFSAKQWVLYDQATAVQADVTSGRPVRLYRVVGQWDSSVRHALRVHNATATGGTDFVLLEGQAQYLPILEFGPAGKLFDQGLTVEWVASQAGGKVLLVYEE